MKAIEIFTPGSLPTHTYYARPDLNLEYNLLNAIETKGYICSVSGPSKSGKTVLCESVIGKRGMLLVTGGGITEESFFWQRLRAKLGLPASRTTQKGTSTSTNLNAELSGGGSIPFVAKVEGKLGGSLGGSLENSTASNYEGPDGVGLLDYIRDRKLTLVVDDFHYIARPVQKSLAQQFKEAARDGCIIVVVSVTHRADDAIRVNPDLRGRVASIDIPYWSIKELEFIATKGFPLLELTPALDLIHNLSKESVTSPQLMQALCLQVCREFNIEETQLANTPIELNAERINHLFKQAISIANCKTAFDVILTGARTRGSERNSYTLNNNQTGDVYYVILKAIASSDPLLTLPYSTLKQRIEVLVPIDPPRGVGITGTLEQMHKAVEEKLGEDRVLEWDREKETLDIPDPYFLYYLRWSNW